LSNVIKFEHATLRFNDVFALENINWEVHPGEVWAITGTNGSGKSALAASLNNDGILEAGAISGLYEQVGLVSLEAQAALIERERERDDSDITDVITEGTLVQEMLEETCRSESLLERLVDVFNFEPMLRRGFRKLSTGETRKVLLTRALTTEPEMLVLDEPFEGLDAATVPLVKEILEEQSNSVPMVLVFNRFDEIPSFVTHVAFLENGSLKYSVRTEDKAGLEDLSQLLHLKQSDIELPDRDESESVPKLEDGQPLVRIKNAAIRYGEHTVFEKLDWTIERGQHWQLTGPNGSGKTCLLNLITGDHPQCYNNDIYVFGYKRGSGESIWDIKQHIGYVSTSLQWEYRVSISLINVVISGFFDSIGLYERASDAQKQIAYQWLQVLDLQDKQNEPFNQLSYGDQRLLLIARAMVKHPHMLILDEPCLGLDDINRQLILALIEKICAGSETTVLYVNHHAEDKIAGISKFISL
jgi:molybdate transport system ATP-binding protein